MEAFEKYLIPDNNILSIFQDEYAENPYLDNGYENVNFYTVSRQYELGDKNFSSYEDMLISAVSAVLPESKKTDWFYEENIKQFEKALDRYAYVTDVYIYSHSGISINTKGFSCRWDSGKIGIIFIAKRDAKKIWKSKTKEKAYNYLNSIIETYDEYLTGNVYGYQLHDLKENLIDSCWGFYGYKDLLINMGFDEEKLKEIYDYEIKALKNNIENNIRKYAPENSEEISFSNNQLELV